MASQVIENHRENAEVYQGAEICKQKYRELLEEISLPKGLLPLNDLLEVGYNRSTGFVWVKRSKSTKHLFAKIGKPVLYDTEVTAFVESRRMKRLTGVKSKELLIWVTINEIYIDDPSSGKITFGTPLGVSRSFPVSAFEDDDEK
ncbi:hypothetical protein Nepgr_003327 [Nepenthes gracilis]|uniref:DUF538 domain-containing protein n=1 Tax=Nepenthes gracilis TaxID=150966 RepID=A0AAD3RZC2_NEPGR|nr:hypothetical protein Nepgr_003327 [Nepenthes gracilis]